MAEVLLIGSGNRGKAAELAGLLEGLPWEVRCLADYDPVPPLVENGLTFEQNAVKKAVYFSEAFGVACLGDDSGLVVDAIGGAPGIYSARYAGPEADDKANNAKLLAALEGVAEAERTARFVCYAAFVRPGEPPHVENAVAEGRIGFKPRGAGGFGYDPLFIPEGYTRTFGEMEAAEKKRISHRGLALQKMRSYLERLAVRE
ncbi:MAG TPA: RdgB/HAM1 family non-canonical purine NTP pyrophosphatase [Candidatus Bathyarchaeia archaeon]|nr:RdgB/HAM1 family non-canonical purine NTP pyrophosphatase [Candidatus Bathyarchaeia archaeon]